MEVEITKKRRKVGKTKRGRSDHFTESDSYRAFKEMDKIGPREYSKILSIIFKDIIEQMVYQARGYEMFMGLYMRVLKCERKFSKPVVNHPESNRNKRAILEGGGVPFETIKDDKGFVVGDNGGEKWLVYYTDKFYFIFKEIFHKSSKWTTKTLHTYKLRFGRPACRLLSSYTTSHRTLAESIYATA